MYNFTTETQGLDTFLVCEIPEEKQLDTLGLGMLINNKIIGLCPVSEMQIDNKEYIRYNVSSQIPLKQFFLDKVDKKRFLNVLNNILTTVESMEDYMLDPGMLLLEKEHIYVNVGTLQTDLIYFPILEHRRAFDVCTFTKNMIMNTEFDSNDCDNYVTQLISYLNHVDQITIAELRKYIVMLLQENNTTMQPTTVQDMSTSFRQSTTHMEVPVQPVIQQNAMRNSLPYSIPEKTNQSQQPMANNTEFAVPVGDTIDKQEKKQGFFSFFSKNTKKNKVKKETLVKSEKKKSKKDIVAPSGVVIPNMDNTKNSTLPQPPKPVGAANLPLQSQRLEKQQSLVQPVVEQQPLVQPVVEQQPVMQQPLVQPVVSQQPVMQQPLVQPVVSQQSVIQQSPMMQKQTIIHNCSREYNIGETVVLGTETSGETTVLNNGYNTLQRQRNPHLIRKKTNERVEINKNIFRIGKERSYVDYCISDNSAVSRSHADIIKKNNEFYIVDNNSLNHTFLNGKQIPSSQMQKLEDYMMIQLADELFEFKL